MNWSVCCILCFAEGVVSEASVLEMLEQFQGRDKSSEMQMAAAKLLAFDVLLSKDK